MNFIFRYFSSLKSRNTYFVLIYNLLLVYLLFTVTRLAFYIFNLSLFPGINFQRMMRIMVGGLYFDTSAILYTNLLYIIALLLPFSFRYKKTYQTVTKIIFLTTNGIALAANCADIAYYKFSFRRTTASVFSEFGNEANILSLSVQFLSEYWYLLLLFVLMILFLAWAFKKPVNYYPLRKFNEKLFFFASGIVIIAIFSVFIVAGLRGGFRHSTRPITLSNAGQFVDNPNEIAIVLNTPFAVYRTIGKKTLEYKKYFENNEDLELAFNPVHIPSAENQFKPMNVVIIIIESMGREYISRYNQHLIESGDYTGYTPFLDSIIDKSLMFRYSFSNGRKSIDVLPSVLSSIPMMVEPYVLTKYASNRINSIGSLLEQKGYHTSFFHGAPNGSMGFLAFTNIAGFKEYYGMSEYGNKSDFDGYWGIWDEEFLQFWAEKINEFPQPFCTAIFTTTSHHPYNLPQRYNNIFPKGIHPMHECAGYTDYAFRRFFETISKTEWFENTLFVFTADHPNRTFIPEYQTNLGAFAVPLFFYKADNSLTGVHEEVAQQIDIMPSVLGYMEYDQPFIAFGRNLFDTNTTAYTLQYFNSYYLMTMDKYLIYFDGEKITNAYDFVADPLLLNDDIGILGSKGVEMETMLKAFIQQYNKRLIDNELIIN